MHLITSELDQKYYTETRSEARSKTDRLIKSGCNLEAISNESLIYLIASKLKLNIINILDQKRINRSKLDAN